MHLEVARAAGALLLCAMLGGCASVVPVQPADPLAAAPPAAVPELRFDTELPIRLSTGYTRAIPKGSLWRLAGALPQGAVYRPVGTVFAIEGRQVHEAWLVVHAGAVHGFYLPGEGNYSPLVPPLSLPPSTGAKR